MSDQKYFDCNNEDIFLGIAKMGPPTDPMSVVNHELKVSHGVKFTKWLRSRHFIFSGLRSSEAAGDRRLDHAACGVREHQRPHHHDRGEGGGHDQS